MLVTANEMLKKMKNLLKNTATHAGEEMYNFRIPLTMSGYHFFTYKRTQHGYLMLVKGNKFIGSCMPAGIFSIIYCCHYLKFNGLDQNDVISYYGVIFLYSFITVVGLISHVVFLFIHESYIDAVNICTRIDIGLHKRKLETVDHRLYYFLWSQIILCAANCTYFAFFCESASLLDVICLSIPTMIRFFPMFLIITTSMVGCKRLTILQNYLNIFKTLDVAALRHIRRNSYSHPVNMLQFSMEIHDSIVTCSHYFHRGLGFILAINILANIVHIIYAIMIFYFSGIQHLSTSLCIYLFLAVNLVTAGLFYYAQQVDSMMKDTIVTLGHINITFCDSNLAAMKNSILLHTLHNKLNLTLLRVLPMKMNNFLKQIEMTTTIVLLLIQYTGKMKANQ